MRREKTSPSPAPTHPHCAHRPRVAKHCVCSLCQFIFSTHHIYPQPLTPHITEPGPGIHSVCCRGSNPHLPPSCREAQGCCRSACPPAFGTETFLEKTSKKTEGRWYFFPADWAVWGHSMQHFIRCTVPRSCKQQQLSGWPPTPAAQHKLCASQSGKHRKKRETHRLPAQSLCDVPELQQPAQHQPLSCLLSQQHGHGRSMHCCPCEALGAVSTLVFQQA